MGWFESIFSTLKSYWFVWSPLILALFGFLMFLSRQKTKRHIKSTAVQVKDNSEELAKINDKLDKLEQKIDKTNDAILTAKNELQSMLVPIGAYVECVSKLQGNEALRAQLTSLITKLNAEAQEKLKEVAEVVETVAEKTVEQVKKLKLKAKVPHEDNIK